MEKLRNLISSAQLIEFVHRMRESKAENISVNFLWRLLLGGALVVAVIIGFVAWSWYDSVITESAPSPASKTKDHQAAFSIEELRGVISLYQKKEDDFNILHSAIPSAPPLNKGSGVSSLP